MALLYWVSAEEDAAVQLVPMDAMEDAEVEEQVGVIFLVDPRQRAVESTSLLLSIMELVYTMEEVASNKMETSSSLLVEVLA
jgi:hypothetical protein